MTWLAPWALGAGALGLLGVVAAHLLSRQRPRALALATARFLPAGMLEATTIQRVPMDRWWMLLRLMILALLALGVAQPIITGSRVPVRTVLLLDRSLPVTEQRRLVASLRESDVVLGFGSTTVVQNPREYGPGPHLGAASLSAAFARLVRVRDSLATGASQLRVEIAATFAPESFDVASESLRAMIPDSIVPRIVTVTADSARVRRAIEVHAEANDPIAATAQLLGDSAVTRQTIIERGLALTTEDSLAAERGAVVLWWPARIARDTAHMEAITVGRSTWIANMQRDAVESPTVAKAIGWWADGAVGVTQRITGQGCLLRVRAALPVAGDQTLSLSAQAWLAATLASCVRPTPAVAPPPAWLVAPTRAVATADARVTHSSSLAPWLVGAALALAALELLLRMRTARA